MSISNKLQANALALGGYITGRGVHVRLRTMNDDHLVNALVKALAEERPESITTPLAAEVDRRGLRGRAIETVEKRS